MNKATKIALGGVAAVALVGGGIGLARATSGTPTATDSPSAQSSVSVLAPGEQPQGGQMPGGQPPADGQQPPGGPGGGMTEELASMLGVDADTLRTALEELRTENQDGQPMHPGSTEFASALAGKLGLDEATVTEALSVLTPPEPPQGGQQPGPPGQSAPSAAPSATATAES